MEIAFPNKFQFSRRYCEKVDALRRLEDLVARIAGRILKITITSCPDGADDVPIAIKSDAKKPARVYRPENDPYVVTVMNAFSAQVVKVDPVIASSPASEES